MSDPCAQEDVIHTIKSDVEVVKVDVREAFSDIKRSVELFHSSQTRMTEILVDIAKGSERQIAQAQRINENRESIIDLSKDITKAHEKLRDLELSVTSSLGKKYPYRRDGDSKFDKVQVTVITTLGLTVLHAFWGIVSGLVKQIQSMLPHVP